MHAFGFRLRANTMEGQKRFPISKTGKQILDGRTKGFMRIIQFLYKRGFLRLLDLSLIIIPRYIKTVFFLALADSLRLKNLCFDMPLILSEKSDDIYFMNLSAVPRDRSVLPYIAHKQMWEIVEPRMSISWIADQQSYEIIDAGANMGLFTLQLLALLKQAGRIAQVTRVHLIEPDPTLVPVLRNNCEQFSAEDVDFNIIEKAIGLKDGPSTFYLDKGNNTNNSLRPEAIELSVDGAKEIEVDVISGQSLLDVLNLNPQSKVVYKSDLQGSDTDVMLSIPEEFWRKVDIIIVEVWPWILAESALDVESFTNIASQFDFIAKIDRYGNVADLTDKALRSILSIRSKYEYFNIFCARSKNQNKVP